MRLARVGLANVAVYLAGGILELHGAGLPLATTEQIGVEEIDARRREGLAGRVEHPREESRRLSKAEPVALICAGGFRSSIATSILEQNGFTRVTNVVGGMAAGRGANLEVAA